MEKERKRKNRKIVILGFIIFASLIIIAAIIFGSMIYKSIEKAIFPLKFTDEVKAAAEEFNVPEPLIYSVIKAESSFREEAVSSAGAKGLMQLMPDTYSWLAKKLGDDGDIEKICDPKTNIRYGVYYLSTLLKKYSDTDTALCAYNAGPGRVDSWLSDTRYSSDGKTISEIPYNETRKYVEKVNNNIEKYCNLYDMSV